MKKNIRIIMSFVLLAVVLFTAFPKVYIHKLMGHNHMQEHSIGDGSTDIVTPDNTTQNCDLEKFETGKQTIHPSLNNLIATIEHSIEPLQQLIKNKKIW